MYTTHQQLFEEFTATFPPEVVAGWGQMITEWEGDMSKPNPYEEPAKGSFCLFCGHIYILILFL